MIPETCPFCGAEPYITASGAQCRGGDRWVLFSCDTSIYAGQDLRRTQSRKCEDAERARLAARVTELEAQNAQMQSELDHAKARSKEIEKETLRLEDLAKNRGKLMTQAVDQSRDLEARVAELEARCNRLKEAGDRLAAFTPSSSDRFGAWRKARKAKEAKP